MDIKNVIDYYINLLIIQYRNKEKARKTIELYVKTLLKDDIFDKVENAFNLDTAVGKQLDIIGKNIGIDRFFNSSVAPVGTFFSMTSYDTLGTDSGIGMTDYNDIDTDQGTMLSYNDLITENILDDDDYRKIIKLRIVQNNSDHTNGSIDDSLFRFFGSDLVMSDGFNMTIVYFFDSDDLRFARISLEKGVLPRPMGVRIGSIIKRKSKFFGYITYDNPNPSSKVTGYTDYTEGFNKEGETLTYDDVVTV